MIDPSAGVKAEGLASGNGASLGTTRNVDLDSRQTVDAAVKSTTDVEVHGWTPSTTASSTAGGNTGEACAIEGAAIKSTVRQVVVDGSAVEAKTDVRAELSSSGDTDASSTSVGNSQSFAVGTGAYSKSETLQRQHGSVKAATDASLFHVKGTATLGSAAASNTLTHTGNGASGEADVHQHATGQTVATTVAGVRSGYLVDGTAEATGNAASLQTLSHEAMLTARQKQEGYVRAETHLYVQDFGGVTASASGVGNSVIAENSADWLEIYADQENDGLIDVEASFVGGDGYDATVNATAYGNNVYGSVCGDCDGTLKAENRQVNTAGVNATARTVVSGSARTVTSTARAVGNNAAFYTWPHD